MMPTVKTTQQLLQPHSGLIVQICQMVEMDTGYWEALYALPIDRTAAQSPDAVKRKSKVIGIIWIVWIVWIVGVSCFYHSQS